MALDKVRTQQGRSAGKRPMVDEATYHGAWGSAAFAPSAAGTDGTESMLRRLRRIERTLGVRFDPNLGEILSPGTNDTLDPEQQMSELLQTFRQIPDETIRRRALELFRSVMKSQT